MISRRSSQRLTHGNRGNRRLPGNTWWGEAPEWATDLNEASDIHLAIGVVRPLSMPSRRSIAGPRLDALFRLPAVRGVDIRGFALTA
jgi:hypothetical protein